MKFVKLNKSVLSLFNCINDFKYLVEEAWDYSENYPLSFNLERYWLGFYIKDKKNKNRKLFWIGFFTDSSDLYFYIQDDKNTLKELYGKEDPKDSRLISRISFKEIFPLSGSEQKKYIENWFNKIMKNKLKGFVDI